MCYWTGFYFVEAFSLDAFRVRALIGYDVCQGGRALEEMHALNLTRAVYKKYLKNKSC